MTNAETLANLRTKIDPRLLPVFDEFSPVLASWTVEKIWEWINLIGSGKALEAYKLLVSETPSRKQLWADLDKEWAQANQSNHDDRDLFKSVGLAIVKVLLPIAFALVGL